MKKKSNILLLWLFLAAMTIYACSSGGSDNSDTDTDTPHAPIAPGSDEYVSMIERSLLSSGNNTRLKKVLEKAANGEEVNIAYIGGSITEGYTTDGDSYVIGSYEAFKENFASGDGSHINYVNAGMGGTPSSVGMVRYKRDVLDEVDSTGVKKPDIVFVEFAVNDADDPTNGAAYESMVKDILEADNEPAVVLIFSVFRNHWNLQDRLAPIGTDYQLPMISIKDAVVPELEAGSITHDEFFRDDYHPSTYGFKIMTDCITYLFSTVEEQTTAASDITIPAAATIGTQFSGIQMIDSDTADITGVYTLEDVGSFTSTDTSMRSVSYNPFVKIFPDNWSKKDATTNNPFTMNVNCKNLVLLYKLSDWVDTYGDPYFGHAEVTIYDVAADPGFTNPVSVTTLDGNPSGAWNNPWTNVLIDTDTAKEYRVEIKMTDADAALFFTLLAFGYTE